MTRRAIPRMQLIELIECIELLVYCTNAFSGLTFKILKGLACLDSIRIMAGVGGMNWYYNEITIPGWYHKIVARHIKHRRPAIDPFQTTSSDK